MKKSELGSYKLTHPELLSEEQLREVLRSSSIDLLNFDKLCKNELLEAYKRIVMPLPQRVSSYVTDIGIDTTTPNSVTCGSDNGMQNTATKSNKGCKRIYQPAYSQADEIKNPNADQKPIIKNIRLDSTLRTETVYNGISKRKCENENEESVIKKRQKITWP